MGANPTLLTCPDGSPTRACELPLCPEPTGRTEKLTEGQSTNIYVISWHVISVRLISPREMSCHILSHWQGARLHQLSYLFETHRQRNRGPGRLRLVRCQYVAETGLAPRASNSCSNVLSWAESYFKMQSFFKSNIFLGK